MRAGSDIYDSAEGVNLIDVLFYSSAGIYNFSNKNQKEVSEKTRRRRAVVRTITQTGTPTVASALILATRKESSAETASPASGSHRASGTAAPDALYRQPQIKSRL
jgi:hypothetical protein